MAKARLAVDIAPRLAALLEVAEKHWPPDDNGMRRDYEGTINVLEQNLQTIHQQMGAPGFWVYLIVVMTILAGYVTFRMTQRASVYASEDDYDAVAYAAISPSSTLFAAEVAQEIYAENAESGDEDSPEGESPLDRV